MSNRIIKKCLFYLLTVVSLFILQEIIFRSVFSLPEVSNFNRIKYSQLIADYGENKKKYITNDAFIWASDPDGAESVLHLNIYGFRDKTWRVQPEPSRARVMIAGDSFVEGFMSSDDKTISKGFESAAKEENVSVEAMNFGVGASNTAEYFSLIKDAVPLFKPDYTILVFYANDFPFSDTGTDWFHNDFVPEYSHKFFPRLYYVFEKLLNGESVARTWKREPFMFLTSAEKRSNPLNNKNYEMYVRKFVSPHILDAMRKGRFNPHVINEYSLYKKRLTLRYNNSEQPSYMKKFIEDSGGKLIIVYIPCRSQVSDSYLQYQREFNQEKQLQTLTSEEYQVHAQILRDICSNLNIPFLDTTALIKKYEDNGTRMYWNYDEHMKGDTYSLIGAEIYSFWKSGRNYKKFSPLLFPQFFKNI